ncbi:unnamed protein product [Kluyveromyces dobzhanskii CBS 2104]|uniref:Riboflavin synthase n=1 Tax=Kluyveromyces dobzhanskii CBS 2104 TaxID=1427455 RepID=A0A0A8L6S4_9SACH|nr:unnamed protein product [Kluyveromyces dobzhanskii CBS 2104]
MFTGIVETIGTVAEYRQLDETESGGYGISVTIEDAGPVLVDCHIGDSIACSGICLTVTEFDSNSFKVGISPETVKRTDIAAWKQGTKVNLERAVSQDVRFGGHYVQGHVDTVATIKSRVADGNSIVFGFKLRDAVYEKFIVEKGYISLDGTSLTVTTIDNDGTFYIAMIKHTQEHVVMPLKLVDDLVNVEVDITGKVIEKQIDLHLQAQIANSNSTLSQLISKIVEEKVSEALNK